jgi:gamma-glutamyltranspeptidase
VTYLLPGILLITIASGISCAKAVKMLGYAPKRSWRDYLDKEGRLKIDGELSATVAGTLRKQ